LNYALKSADTVTAGCEYLLEYASKKKSKCKSCADLHSVF